MDKHYGLYLILVWLPGLVIVLNFAIVLDKIMTFPLVLIQASEIPASFAMIVHGSVSTRVIFECRCWVTSSGLNFLNWFLETVYVTKMWGCVSSKCIFELSCNHTNPGLFVCQSWVDFLSLSFVLTLRLINISYPKSINIWFCFLLLCHIYNIYTITYIISNILYIIHKCKLNKTL